MGTKQEPGRYDCLEKLYEDEPFFVLRAQDVLADDLVIFWADMAEAQGCNPKKVQEARDIAIAMKQWNPRKLPD